jgi:hypothetical protein
MGAYENSLAIRRPPHPAADAEDNSTKSTITAGDAATDAVQVSSFTDAGASWILLRFDAVPAQPAGTVIGYITFGVGAAATIEDWPIEAGEKLEWLVFAGRDTHLSVKRNPGAAYQVRARWYTTDKL